MDGCQPVRLYHFPVFYSDVEIEPSDASATTPVKPKPLGSSQTPYTEGIQSSLMSPALQEWLVSPAATGKYKKTETSESRLHRQLAAVQFELTRQRYVNDELECEVKDSKMQIDRAESAVRSLQQQVSQMRDRLDELQHVESLCHKYEQEVQK
jgi:septal ring factor EnvC (AmiA/AmiB activator)